MTEKDFDRVSKFNRAERELYRLGFIHAVHAVAQFVGQWDAHIDHCYKFEDVILSKFNLLKRKKPRNKARFEARWRAKVKKQLAE